MKEEVFGNEEKFVLEQKSPAEQIVPLQIERYFTKEDLNHFEYGLNGKPLNWVAEDVSFTDDRGKVIFTQRGVKKPEFWSSLALKVVASKYFWGDQAKGERENSIEKLIGRIGRFIKRQSLSQKYFDEKKAEILKNEIEAICLNQLAVFNSPVWFNVGIQEYNKNAGGVSAYVWDSNTDEIIKAEKTMDRPQCSACFIQSAEDDMDAILALQVSEGNLFKAGSGTGTNRSPLRSSKEKLTGGGRASGPVSFMKAYDAYAGVIKSGGKTRRAAKMEILNIEHPDIIDFINAKQNEEKKAWALIEEGYDGGMNGEAYETVAFQNCNMSVRVTDEFMNAVKNDGEWKTKLVKTGEVCETFEAKEILNKIAGGTYICGDPGMQFDTIINKYHTCKNSGRINASNPCVTGDTKVLTKDGRWRRIDSLIGKEIDILTNTGIINKSQINGSFMTGTKPVYRLTTKNGYEIKLTSDHKVFTINRGFVPAFELSRDDRVLIPGLEVAEINEPEDKTFFQMLGVYLGDGCGGNVNNNRGIQITMDKQKESGILSSFAEYVSSNYERMTHKTSPASVQITKTSGKYVITNNNLISKFREFVDLSLLSYEKCFSEEMFNLSLGEQKYVLQGLFTADGTVANYGSKSQYVALDSTSLKLLKDVQIILLGFGIKSKLYKNRRAGKGIAMLPDGNGNLKEYKVKEVHSLRISRSGRLKFEKLIGFMHESPKNNKLKLLNSNIGVYEDRPFDLIESLEYVGEEKVYDLTEPLTHTFVANGITVHNCSEYMFLDDSACNLASINLMKFRTREGKFDAESFKQVVKRFIIAMDLFVDGSSYPGEEIARNSRDFRPLGLGYANLGALLMSLGLPYDSEEGRAVAAVITAIMCGEAYKTSAQLAGVVGPFPRYAENSESMLNVIKMHRDHVKDINVNKIPSDLRYLINDAWDSWSDAVEIGEINGFRNSQATVLAPTGTIAFMMDCDTTGIEPDIALVKYKVLSGGGMLKIVNRGVALALQKLGYDDVEIKEIIDYIDKEETIEGAPGLKDEHLAVFDCAFKATKGKRSIYHKGHILMMAVTQPFISGAISKTINMPEHSTIEDIADAYIASWENNLKAVAIYRENSKRSQPLNTQKTEGERVSREAVNKGERVRLPQTHKSITHKFEIAEHEGYLTIGLYDDGKPGEIFITMHKIGSTIRGLMDSWATSVSLNLQYGIPVDVLFSKFRHQKFEPAGFVKNQNGGKLDEKTITIRTASSLVDYVAQFMLNNFGAGAGKIEFEIKQLEKPKEEQKDLKLYSADEGIICPICGGSAKRVGNCSLVCTDCKQTTRSGCGE
ncbi:MAG: LAGLIDADG family homing endonuclease [Candidatus Pacearchaeota archaeon]|nr:LAGLIDADG family homing endonuclease [Candidatus Pacearchaeota archaeon]